MDYGEVGTAIYLAGHGSKIKPRLLELQYQRILRYRRAFLKKHKASRSPPVVFVDLRLPPHGMGTVDLSDVPQFKTLLDEVRNGRVGIVYIDLDEVKPGLTPDYESAFVRSELERAGSKVLNSFTDDMGVFVDELKDRCGPTSRDYEVTDASDVVNFFPSLASDVTAASLRTELQLPLDRITPEFQRIFDRIDGLKRLRRYSGGAVPFIEDRLSSEWQKRKK